MRMDFERFLVLAAAFAAAMGSVGCAVDSSDGSGGGGVAWHEGSGGNLATGGTAPSAGAAGAAAGGSSAMTGGTTNSAGAAGATAGGSSAMTGGTTSSAGAAGATAGGSSAMTGGTTSSAGAGGASAEGGSAGEATAGSANGGAGGTDGVDCAGDVPELPPVPDCDSLPYKDVTCPGNLLPTGYDMCLGYDGWLNGTKGTRYARDGVFEQLVLCLQGAPTGDEACGATHDNYVWDTCVMVVESLACPTDTAATRCATISGKCALVTQAMCTRSLNTLTDTAQAAMVDCMSDTAVSGTGDQCGDYFWNYCIPQASTRSW